MKKISALIFVCCSLHPLWASNLKITNVSFTGSPTDKSNPSLFVYVTLRWENSWNNEKNKDGVWLFFKMNHQNDIRSQRHVNVKKTGHYLVHNYANNKVTPGFYIPDHAAGVLVYPEQKLRGSIHWRLKFELNLAELNGIDFSNVVFGKAFGIEMVHIPEGAFYAGESDTIQQARASAFYDYSTKQHIYIESEKSIAVGKNKGDIFYQNSEAPQYRGDVQGTVSDQFPKGYNSFWIMKYELNQGQYVEFLNSISNTPSQLHANFAGKMYYADRGTIEFENGKYKSDSPERPANFISWDDGCAFADWAGLLLLRNWNMKKLRAVTRSLCPVTFHGEQIHGRK